MMVTLSNPPIPVITIDGPSGAGKGAIASNLSALFGWNLLNSGYIYRATAFLAKKKRISISEESRVLEIVREAKFEFRSCSSGTKVICEDEDITDIIADEYHGGLASKIAINKKIRDELVGKQRGFVKFPGLVAEGRDMGTIIFPNAKLKIFITAGVEERARRRCNQLKEMGITVKIPQLIDEILVRDERDRNRLESPLVPHSDSVVIDTTCLSVGEVMSLVENLARKRFEKIDK